MKNFINRPESDVSVANHHDVEIYSKYLYNNTFRGFYYDAEDTSYGIVLSFINDQTDSLNLFAQESKSGTIITEYTIYSENFHIEQKAYDKLLILAKSYEKEILVQDEGMMEIPSVVEFTLQVLTRNSIYLRFLNHVLFTPPISSFKGGLVLSRDHHYSRNSKSRFKVEAGEWF